ncbi:MAG: HIT domain-containing protein [Patescibacteria group bacterium]
MSDLIFSGQHFTVERHPQPFVDRTEGGHLRIFPKDHSISERRELTKDQALEFMKLSAAAGEALELAMNELGVPVVKINYEDLGNWAFKRGERPVLHLHIFGRSKNAVKQKFPEAVYLPDRSSGFYDDFEPLTMADMKLINKYLVEILETKYKNW